MIPAKLVEQLHKLQAQARSGALSSDIMLWFGASSMPDGHGATPPLSLSQWTANYARLTHGALSPGVLPEWGEMQQRLQRHTADGHLPVAVLNLQYAQITARAREDILAHARQGQILPPPLTQLCAITRSTRTFQAGVWQPPQWGQTDPVARGLNQQFCFPEDGYIGHADASRSSHLRFDPGDGRGPRDLVWGDSLDVSYTEPGEAQLTIQLEYPGDSRTARFSLPVSDRPPAPSPTRSWTLHAADSGNTGHAWIYLAPGHQRLQRALLMAEGFPGGYSPQYLYDTLSQANLLAELQQRGFDLVLIGFDHGMEAMQDNAGVVEDAIRQVRKICDAPLVVGGLSMGGIITRYALTRMEHRDEDHGAAIYLSVDSPHQGAYTGVADQWLAHAFANASPELEQMACLLDSAANQQFVKLWVHDRGAEESPLRRRFMSELNAMGSYPKRPRKLAISCGRGNGGTDVAPAQRFLNWSDSPLLQAELWTLGNQNAQALVARTLNALVGEHQARELTMASPVSWEAVPGAQNVYNAIAAACITSLECGSVQSTLPLSCAVPTVSALDLAIHPLDPVPAPGTLGPFDAYTCSDADYPHLTITAPVRDWLLSQLDAHGSS